MKLIDWRNPAWRKRFWKILTVLLVVLLATHPELRLLLPVVDAIGLDMFIALLGIQFAAIFSDQLKPVFICAWTLLAPLARAADRVCSSIGLLRGIRDFLGYAIFHWLAPQLWLWLHTFIRAVQRGPDHPFKRMPRPNPGSPQVL